jgi:hypothetical protein
MQRVRKQFEEQRPLHDVERKGHALELRDHDRLRRCNDPDRRLRVLPERHGQTKRQTRQDRRIQPQQAPPEILDRRQPLREPGLVRPCENKARQHEKEIDRKIARPEQWRGHVAQDVVKHDGDRRNASQSIQRN